MAHISFGELATHSLQLYESARAGDYVEAWEHSIPLQQFSIESLRGAGFKALPPEEGDADRKKEIIANLRAAKKELGARMRAAKGAKGKKAKGAAPVGKLGDGKLLKALVDALISALLPILFEEGEE